MKFSRLHETLDWVTAGKDRDEKITRARDIITTDSTFVQYLKMAVDPNFKIVGLPEASPSAYRPKYDMPDGVSETVLKTEYRRISHFLDGGSVQNVPEAKRITLWINILEGLHWKEAQILTAIKDQNLLELYPELEEILPEIDVVPKAKENSNEGTDDSEKETDKGTDDSEKETDESAINNVPEGQATTIPPKPKKMKKVKKEKKTVVEEVDKPEPNE